jgi:addiction module RelE/StbE family toxin
MVKWTLTARNDLRAIHNYISEDSKFYARRVIENIVESTEKLKDFPQIGRVVPELEDKDIRELIVYSYRVIYEMKNQDIEILAIIHGKREFANVYKQHE